MNPKDLPAAARTTSNGTDWIARARALTRLLAAAGPRIDANKALPPEVLDALHEAKMFRMFLPQSMDGAELDPPAFFEVILAITAGAALPDFRIGEHLVAVGVELVDRGFRCAGGACGHGVVFVRAWEMARLNGVFPACGWRGSGVFRLCRAALVPGQFADKVQAFGDRQKDHCVTAKPHNTISLAASEFQPGEMYFLLRDSIVPRPIAWVSTISNAGVSNIAPFSFFNVCCPSPPVLGFSCGPRGDDHNDPERRPKDTLLNIRENGEFVVNLSPEGMFDEMLKSSDDLPHDKSEFAYTGMREAPSTAVRPPRVVGTPVAYECKLYDIIDIGANKWIMGTVVHVHIDAAVYSGEREGKRHRVDLLKNVATRPLGRLGRAFYVRLRDFETRLRKDGPN